MNAHDSERIKGMLEELGWVRAPSRRGGRSRLQHPHDPREAGPALRRTPRPGAGAQGSRSGEGDRRGRVLRRGTARAPLRALSLRGRRLRAGLDPAPGEWLGAGGEGVSRGRFGLEQRSFASLLPMHRERRFQGWVQVSMGCNSKCAYCIVPSVRGREQSRRARRVIAEVEGLPAQASARSRCSARTSTRTAVTSYHDIRTDFGELLRACDAVKAPEDPIHEPALEGLSRAGDRGDSRVRLGASTRTCPSSPAPRES